MASVFQPCGPAISKVVLDCAEAGGKGKEGFITVTGGCGGDGGLGLPITNFRLELQCNYQFLHTVNDFIYLYVFGDRVGELHVSGMGFLGDDCGNAEKADSGTCKAFSFYNSNKVSACTEPLRVALSECNGASFFAFLTGVAIEQPRPDLPIVQWGLRFNVVQQKA